MATKQDLYKFMINNSVYFTKKCTESQAQKELERFAMYFQAGNNSLVTVKVHYELIK
jgi:hypothetical protein